MKFTFAMTAALAAAVLAAPLLPAGSAAEARSLDHYSHNILARDVVAQPAAAAKREVEPFGVEGDQEKEETEAELEARSKVGDLAKKLGNLAKDKSKKLLGARDGMTAEQYAQEYDEEHPDQTAQEAGVEEAVAAAEAAGLEARGTVGDIAKKLGQIAKDKGKKLLGRDGMTAEQYAEEYDKEHPEQAAQEAALESDENVASLEARGKLADLAKKLAAAAKKKLLGARDGMTAEQYAQEYDEEHPEEAALESDEKAA